MSAWRIDMNAAFSKRRLQGIVLLALIGACLPRWASAQSLGDLRYHVRAPRASHAARESTPAPTPAPDPVSSEPGFFDEELEKIEETLLVLGLFLGVAAVSAPFTIPKSALGDDGFDLGYFERYPYLHGMDGYLEADLDNADDPYPWLLRTRVEYVDDFDSLNRLGGQLMFDTAIRLGLDTEVNYHREVQRGGQEDSLWMGDFNLTFRFAQTRRTQLRAGLGVNWLSDRIDTDFGFNFTYTGDWFPRDPWIVSTEIDWGRLGNVELFHGRVTVGVHYHRFELYTGYDYLDVGDAQLDGLVAGIRLWY